MAPSTDSSRSLTFLHMMGKGSYGHVYKALAPDGPVAIKALPVADGNAKREVDREIDALRACAGEWVVSLREVIHGTASLWLVMECADLGSILDIMRRQRACLSEPEIKAVCASVLRGLQHLHERQVVHRDVKAANLLLTRDGRVKLADFGVASVGGCAQHDTVIGTPLWMSPEQIGETGGYTCKTDVWSLGITAIEMAEGKTPLAGVQPLVHAMFRIVHEPAPTLQSAARWHAHFQDWLGRLLVKDPEQRANASELSDHPFILSASPSSCLKLATAAVQRRQRAAERLHKQASAASCPEEALQAYLLANQEWASAAHLLGAAVAARQLDQRSRALRLSEAAAAAAKLEEAAATKALQDCEDEYASGYAEGGSDGAAGEDADDERRRADFFLGSRLSRAEQRQQLQQIGELHRVATEVRPYHRRYHRHYHRVAQPSSRPHAPENRFDSDPCL